MGDDDVPVEVFRGPYTEVVFLTTLIESAGIETSLDRTRAGTRLFVRRADVAAARELVEHFEKHGQRTKP